MFEDDSGEGETIKGGTLTITSNYAFSFFSHNIEDIFYHLLFCGRIPMFELSANNVVTETVTHGVKRVLKFLSPSG